MISYGDQSSLIIDSEVSCIKMLKTRGVSPSPLDHSGIIACVCVYFFYFFCVFRVRRAGCTDHLTMVRSRGRRSGWIPLISCSSIHSRTARRWLSLRALLRVRTSWSPVSVTALMWRADGVHRRGGMNSLLWGTTVLSLMMGAWNSM